jgi:leader peptidase (prepilin peptidase)/N-methyltransferase
MAPYIFEGILSLLLGLCLGSFLNVCIHRLPLKQSILRPASHCPWCGNAIRFYDNIPLLSYIFLAGRCRDCSKPISWRYPAVEALTGLISVLLFITYGINFQFFLLLLFLLALITISFIDLDHQIIPDIISIPGIAAGLLASPFLPHTSFLESLIGAAAGGGSLFIVAYLYAILVKRPGMGGGDIKMLAMIGAWMGWRSLPMIVFLSSFSGALVGFLYLSFSGRGLRVRIPFGPFLSLGTVLYLFAGKEMIRFYLRVIS